MRTCGLHRVRVCRYARPQRQGRAELLKLEALLAEAYDV